jgi:hypothetical protein
MIAFHYLSEILGDRFRALVRLILSDLLLDEYSRLEDTAAPHPLFGSEMRKLSAALETLVVPVQSINVMIAKLARMASREAHQFAQALLLRLDRVTRMVRHSE